MSGNPIELPPVPRNDVLVQRDLILEAYASIEEAIADRSFDLPAPDEPVLLVSDKGKIYEFNLVAAFIWEKLGENLQLPEVIESICRSFEVSRQTAEHDLDGFLRYLKHIALLKEEHAATSGSEVPDS